MKIAMGCDHGGYELKEKLKQELEQQGHKIRDCGTDSLDSCDYPVFGEAAARAVASGECERGIVICTTGIGISIAANKVRGIRCPPAQQRQHDRHRCGLYRSQAGKRDGKRIPLHRV